MNTEQKRIIIAGVKKARLAIRSSFTSATKTPLSKVTTFDYGIPADKESEKILVDAIKESRIDAKIISEESSIMGRDQAEYNVYLDPIDGSVNFSRGIPSCCIGVGIYKKNLPVLGIIYDVGTDELFIADFGHGVTINGRKINSPFIGSTLLVNLEWFGAPLFLSIVTKLKQKNIRARIAGSGVLALCYGCIGRGDGSILIENRPWDIAPGMIFAMELGCIIKQFNGDTVDLQQDKQNIIVAPENIYKKLVDVVTNVK
jgi:myo-inositol-1(or 4)-monophosphatase